MTLYKQTTPSMEERSWRNYTNQLFGDNEFLPREAKYNDKKYEEPETEQE